MNIKILENGDLELSLADKESCEELADENESQRGYWTIMAELFEDTACNGSFTHFDAGQGNPYVGLTSAPCIAESMDIDDDGNQTIIGRAWYFDRYCYDMENELLAKGEKVIYTLIS